MTQFGLFDKYDEMLPSDAPFFSQITLYVTHRGDWWKRIRSESKHPVDPAAVQLPAYMADHPRIREEFACYLDQVEYMDAEVGMILDRLEQRGLADNTVVFFIGDNGRADIRAKGFLYDHGTRVPMIVWGKGVEPAVVNDLVSTMDITGRRSSGWPVRRFPTITSRVRSSTLRALRRIIGSGSTPRATRGTR